ncbi:hamartin-like, partial [Diadema antillarum]|uniref:hamartin-like n=2 Tax=Diadema antillarum TaxID=105358 RepID=UPI003A8448D8
NSFQAQDILAGVREPHDKPLLDKLNECLKSSSSRLPALTLLSHIVRRQPSWLYKIVQTPLFASLITCLKTDTDIPVLMCGVLMVTILLPMIPSQVGPFLHDICEIFARLATWNVHKPGDVHDVHQLHLQAGVYALFHRLYGMYPWNFLEFLQAHFANKEKEFNCAILPMLERVRMHPRLITGQKSKETDLTRWRKMEVHDILMECARVSLDTTESTCDDHSTNSLSLSESRQGATSHTATRSNVSSACKVASPVTTSDSLSLSDTKHASSTKQQTPTSLPKKPDPTSSLISSQAILSMMWSPAVDCGLTTPPSSHPPSPGGSLMDLSTTSSLQMGYGDPSSSLTTPRDSPHSAFGEEQTQRLFNISEGHTPSKAVRKAVRKGPSALPRHQNILQRTTSAPSTPGYEANGAWLPTSPIRKGSVDRSVFNFGGRASFMRQACKPGENQNSNRESTVRSLQSSGRGPGPGLEERVLEDSVEETNEQKMKCHKAQQEDSSDEHGTSVSLKDLPNVIKDLSAEHRDHREQEDANNAEVFSIVSSPQHNEEFMSKVIAGLNQHKGESKESTHYISTALNGTPNYSFVMNSTPKFEVGRSFGPSGHEMAEEKDSNDLPAEHSDSLCDSEKPGEGQSTDKSSVQAGECQCNAEQNSISEGPHHSPGGQKISQKLFREECAGNTSSEKPGVRPAYATGETTEETELTHKEPQETLHRQSSINQGFTPIRDCSVDSIESPYTFTSSAHTSAHQAFMAFSHLFPLVTPSYLYTSHSDMATSVSRSKGDHVTSSEVQSVTNPLHLVFSPTEILDRHIAMSDEVHDKELSRLPLTSQKSVNWTHYGGSPPADEINVLKGQLQLLHNQLLYERHKREVHAGRNRRLLGKTHKAKALEELNTAMKDQLRLQEEEILRLSTRVKQLQLEKRQFSNDCSLKDQQLRDDVRKLESGKVHLMECNEELNKLLVSHKQEVDKMKKVTVFLLTFSLSPKEVTTLTALRQKYFNSI